MSILGLTPIDTEISVFGLVWSEKLNDLFFVKSQIGLVAFAVGFLGSLWESSKRANFKYFIVFLCIFFTGLFLFVIPQHLLGSIKSAQETYGSSTFNYSFPSNAPAPLLLSYFSQAMDAVSFTAISRADELFDDNLKFLSSPFGIQKLSFQSNALLNTPLPDVRLREDLEDFLYAFYWPSLMLYAHDYNLSQFDLLWPGDKQIASYYSYSAQNQWTKLESRLKAFINTPSSIWSLTKERLHKISSSQDNFDNQILSSMINAQYDPKNKMWLKWATYVHVAFPYLLGWGNFCLYVSFPFLMLAILIVRRLGLLLHYLECFLWVKSWIPCAAISFYISLLTARVQAETSTNIVWFWECPYFVLIGSFLLLFVPIISFLGIHKSFQWGSRH